MKVISILLSNCSNCVDYHVTTPIPLQGGESTFEMNYCDDSMSVVTISIAEVRTMVVKSWKNTT